MKNFLGLDLGTNSIGWALVKLVEEGENVESSEAQILGVGSRIIPLGDDKANFEMGNKLTRNADRRTARTARKNLKRYKQRRNKLLYLLKELGLLPKHIRFGYTDKVTGTVIEGEFPEAERLQTLFVQKNPEKGTKQLALNGKLDPSFIELRCRAIEGKITAEEWGTLLYFYNQRRGYNGGDDEDEDSNQKAPAEQGKEVRIMKASIEDVDFEKVKPPRQPKKGEILQPEAQDSSKQSKPYVEVTIKFLETDEYHKFCLSTNSYNRFKDKDLSNSEEVHDFKVTYKDGKITSCFLVLKTDWRNKLESFEKEFEKKAKDALQAGKPYFLCHYWAEKLKEKSDFRIRTNVILRRRYEDEFKAVWDKQIQFHKIEEKIKPKFDEILDYIFPGKNKSGSSEHKQNLYGKQAKENGLYYLIKEQIIYFQRELKPQDDKIGGCQFEKETTDEGKPVHRVIAKSHPLYQDYVIWQQINNLSVDKKTEEINKKGKSIYESRLLKDEEKVMLYEKMHQQKELNFSAVFKILGLVNGRDYLHGLHVKKNLKGNQTLFTIRQVLGEEIFAACFGLSQNKSQKTTKNKKNQVAKATFKPFYPYDKEINSEHKDKFITLWKLLFDRYGNEMDSQSPWFISLKDFLDEMIPQKEPYLQDREELIFDFCRKFAKNKFKREYGSISEKAIGKILPFMQVGEYFDREKIRSEDEKIEKIRNGEHDPSIDNSIRQYHEDRLTKSTFERGGMQAWAAATLIYGKHTAKEYTGDDLIKSADKIQPVSPHTLRNPVVEQLLNETLKIVKEIWINAKTNKPPFDEIRIELSRDLKNNAEERKKITDANVNAEKANKRAKLRLMELQKEITPANLDRYKLWSAQAIEKEPSKSEVEKYRIWEEQKHISPYTGKPIPLSRLFTEDYEVDHIIPRQRFFDDSMGNKIVCESSVNKEKSNRLAMEYINQGSQTLEIKSPLDYEEHVRAIFKGRKLKNLLATKVPEDFVERQKKDTQYISIKVKEELGKIIGTENVKTTTGGVTDYLRQHWGLNDLFKRMNRQRYELMGLLTGEGKEAWVYEQEVERNGKKRKELVLKNWSKRYDHRHHALDAIVIACTNQKHIKKLNDLNKELQTIVETRKDEILKMGEIKEGESIFDLYLRLREEEKKSLLSNLPSVRHFDLPFKGFKQSVEKALESLIVSHKIKNRLILNKDKKSGRLHFKVRSALHQETIYGIKEIPESERLKSLTIAKAFETPSNIKDEYIRKQVISLIEETDGDTAAAIELSKSVDYQIKDKKGEKVSKVDMEFKFKNTQRIPLEKLAQSEKALDNVIGDELKRELKEHLEKYPSKTAAFTGEGAEEFNDNRKRAGKLPVYRLKVFYSDEIGDLKLDKIDRGYIKTGDNYCFAVLEKRQQRIFYSLSLFDAVTAIKKGFAEGNKDISSILTKKIESENPNTSLLFTLMQDDLVFLPFSAEELNLMPQSISQSNYYDFWYSAQRIKRIYRVVKFSDKTAFFSPFHYSQQLIYAKTELSEVESEDESSSKSLGKGKPKKKEKHEFGSYKNCCPFVFDEGFIKNLLSKQAKSEAKKNGKTISSTKSDFEPISIQEHCIKIKIDRLGNISKA